MSTPAAAIQINATPGRQDVQTEAPPAVEVHTQPWGGQPAQSHAAIGSPTDVRWAARVAVLQYRGALKKLSEE